MKLSETQSSKQKTTASWACFKKPAATKMTEDEGEGKCSAQDVAITVDRSAVMGNPRW